MNETSLMRRIQVFCSGLGAKVFRNQVGTYKILRSNGTTSHLSSGLCKGSSDLIGWRAVVIGPDMVGSVIAQFVAIEVKSGKAPPSKDQIAFIEQVRRDGGLAFVARTELDIPPAFN